MTYSFMLALKLRFFYFNLCISLRKLRHRRIVKSAVKLRPTCIINISLQLIATEGDRQ